MTPETISAIHNFTLQARELLEKEVGEQLEGIYGLLPSGKLETSEKYPALAKLHEAGETRKRLEQFLEDEKAADVYPKEARDKLAKETAFTWLNRLVAFKMMESPKLLRQIVSKGPQSNGFLMWLTEPGNEKDYEKHEQGDLPQNALGEGPRQEAYRHFLLWQCGQLAQEIRVLFDPDNLASRLFPRHRALSQLIEKMSDTELEEAWAPGNEETIGWVYQSFNSEDLEKAFREARLSGKKFEAKDISSVTQLFTPRWIVRYLVENTLGRLWVEMHPDSRLKEQLEYLVPIESDRDTPLKPVKEITLLDPACGTMHFGLIAFDLFVRMYQEEIEHAGEQGWPETPLVESEGDMPAAILANNIYGIDIDMRAVQLSALTLYLKAKSINPKAKLKESKLASADIHMLDGDRMKDFLNEMGIKQPTLKRVLTALQARLQDVEQLGSLLRFEEEIQSLVQKERERFEKEGRQMDLFGWSKEQFETEVDQQEFWDIISVQIEQALHLFAKAKVEQGRNQTFFAEETTKGLKLLELLTNRYDVVVTNPPYMSSRKMNKRLKSLVSKSYPDGKRDLYAAFIQRCLELACVGGRVGMLTMHSFMFISSYEMLRNRINRRAVVETLAHLGPGLFSVGNPGTLQTAAYVFYLELDNMRRQNAFGLYFRLVRELDGSSKRRRFEELLVQQKVGKLNSLVFRYHQRNFDSLPKSPWVYWISKKIRDVFSNSLALSDVSKRPNPGNTSDNFRFLRYYWEVRWSNFGVGKRWILYSKGGGYRKWYGNLQVVINWSPEARNFYRKDHVGRVTDEEYWYRTAAVYSSISSKSFSVRFFPPVGVYDRGGPGIIFNKEVDTYAYIGLLNSKFNTWLLGLLNPTVNFQGGDLDRIPIPPINAIQESELIDFVKECIALSTQDAIEDETSYNFVYPAWEGSLEKTIFSLSKRWKNIVRLEEDIDQEVYRLYDISDRDQKAIEAEFAEQGITDSDDQNDSEISNEGDLVEEPERALTSEEIAKRWISYALGIVMGRFELGVEKALGRGRFPAETAAQLRVLADPDAILVMDEGHADDLPVKVVEALTIMLGDEAASEVVKAATSKEGPSEELLRQYLDRQFFKLHIQQYRKRPVYWFLQSPKKKYGVWISHERLNKDSLFRIRTEYAEPKIKLLENLIAELRGKRDVAEGREKRDLDKEIGNLIDLLDDVREFSKRLNFIIEERGYVPHIDDGVLLNMATLWELIPSWQSEPKKAWEALERGDYDWSYQAMDHWPERVKEKCKTNKSYAIAHGLE